MSTYVDTGVLVDALDELDSPGRTRARAALTALDDLVTSVLAWHELCWVVRKRRGVDASHRAATALLNMPGLTLWPIRAADARVATTIMAEHGLKPRDALHAAVAQANGCTRIMSLDRDFSRLDLEWVQP